MSKLPARKLLVTGISGFLGNCIANTRQNNWSIIGVYNNNPVHHPNIKSIRTDLSNQTELDQLFSKIKPDAVLHLAALSNPNFCETHPTNSMNINVDVPLKVALHCQKNSIPFLFTSSDLVFEGTQGPYDETAEAKPLSLYGKHKLAAERQLLQLYSETCIARLPVMFGLPKWSNSFMKAWILNLKENKKIYAFTDEYRTKVSGETAVKGLLLLLDENSKGTWHLGGKEKISRYDFAVEMAKAFNLPQGLIHPSRQADVQMAAARPSDVSLDSSKAYTLGYNPPSIKEELERIKKENF